MKVRQGNHIGRPKTYRVYRAIAVVDQHLLALVEVEAHHTALLTGTRLVHLAAEGHGVQRDVVTNPDQKTTNRWGVEHRLRACECRME